MARNIGKKRWKREPKFNQQFQERRSHITCPKCSASLGDAWEEKGKRVCQYHPNFERQFQEDRVHITCPKCSVLLGETYWLTPTAWDWVVYVFSGNMGWKGRAVVSLIVGMLAALALAVAMHLFADGIPREGVSAWFVWIFIIPVPLLTYFILCPCAIDRWGYYPWWFYNK